MEFRIWFRPPRHILAIFVMAAAEMFSSLANDPEKAVRAGALARLARMRRKMGDPDGAILAYHELSTIPNAIVSGLPAGLIAREGSASVFEEAHRSAQLRSEAAALREDLSVGRWKLTKPEYQFYLSQATAWLGSPDRKNGHDRETRAEAGAAVYNFESVEIGSLLNSLVAEFQAGAADNGYQIEMAGIGGKHCVCADREALSRAIWNLLDNAVKHSPECRTVWIDVEHAGNQVTIAVRDHGLGIPLNEQREIFEKFVRGKDSKKRRIKGTGIGLAMVRRIVKAHGGEITLVSRPGEGSRFAIALPETEGS